MLTITPALVPEHIKLVGELFVEYAESLGFDLCFQDFERELAELPGEYAPPRGRLLLGWTDGDAVGCVALRPIDGQACEMKRLYLRPTARGHGAGKALAVAVIDEARAIGYRVMRLDTVPWMTTAITLYKSLGFREIGPYRHNPIEGAKFMELVF
jgi:GNAT superfamily N-acetyltransferase